MAKSRNKRRRDSPSRLNFQEGGNGALVSEFGTYPSPRRVVDWNEPHFPPLHSHLANTEALGHQIEDPGLVLNREGDSVGDRAPSPSGNSSEWIPLSDTSARAREIYEVDFPEKPAKRFVAQPLLGAAIKPVARRPGKQKKKKKKAVLFALSGILFGSYAIAATTALFWFYVHDKNVLEYSSTKSVLAKYWATEKDRQNHSENEAGKTKDARIDESDTPKNLRTSGQNLGISSSKLSSPGKHSKKSGVGLTTLAPLRPIDYEQYTIRMNTWKRNEQLLMSLNHHTSCPGVSKIHVVWCDPDEEPPPEVMNHASGKVVVEKHEVNTLNERFNAIVPMPTVGILSLDDDVLRPCEALDAGFFRWTRSPERIVGYDIRVHVKQDEGWKYSGKSIAEEVNGYSMVLLRSAFLHRDYLELYMTHLPRSIFAFVAKNFNCEDIAMSLFVTALTKGKLPLLADNWAIHSMAKLYSPSMISAKRGHKTQRNTCVDSFAKELGLHEGENELGVAQIAPHGLRRAGIFAVGEDSPDHTDVKVRKAGARERALKEMLSDWTKKNYKLKLQKLQDVAIKESRQKGLIEKTPEWDKRWGKHARHARHAKRKH